MRQAVGMNMNPIMNKPNGTLARFGKTVRERLLGFDRALPYNSNGLEMFIVQNFVTLEECLLLITKIDTGRKPSEILSANPEYGFRTSDSCNLNPHDPIVKKIEKRIADLLGIDSRHGETLQGQRYAVGQQFKEHHDFFHTDQPYWEKMKRMGGQRSWTAMIFLNEPDAGGATNFPQAGLKVNPQTATLVIWNNMKPDGSPNPVSLHAGMPVEGGVKYIVTKWFRERPWG